MPTIYSKLLYIATHAVVAVVNAHHRVLVIAIAIDLAILAIAAIAAIDQLAS